MRDFLVLILFLGISVFGMSQATTGTYDQCFPEWGNADQVKVTCNGTKIAQFCVLQSCGNISKPGVSLEKKNPDVCLTITSCSYETQSCEAQGYINDKQQEPKYFTVDVCKRASSASSGPEPTSASSVRGNESHTGTIASGVGVPIFVLLIIVLLIILYQKVECFRKTIRDFFRRLRNNRDPNPKQLMSTCWAYKAVTGQTSCPR